MGELLRDSNEKKELKKRMTDEASARRFIHGNNKNKSKNSPKGKADSKTAATLNDTKQPQAFWQQSSSLVESVNNNTSHTRNRSSGAAAPNNIGGNQQLL